MWACMAGLPCPEVLNWGALGNNNELVNCLLRRLFVAPRVKKKSCLILGITYDVWQTFYYGRPSTKILNPQRWVPMNSLRGYHLFEWLCLPCLMHQSLRGSHWFEWLTFPCLINWTITARTGPRRNLFLVNRVEHQKRTQTTAELPFGFVFGVQLGLRQTQALINILYIKLSLGKFVRKL